MWIIIALLILVGWTGIGFVAMLFFFRMGFGLEVRRDAAERMPQAPEPDIIRHRAVDPGYALTPVGYSRRRRGPRLVHRARPDTDQRAGETATRRTSGSGEQRAEPPRRPGP